MADQTASFQRSAWRGLRLTIAFLLILAAVVLGFRAQLWEIAKRQLLDRVLPVPIETLTECPACKGSGKVTYGRLHPLVIARQKLAGENPCQFCDGTGRMKWVRGSGVKGGL